MTKATLRALILVGTCSLCAGLAGCQTSPIAVEVGSSLSVVYEHQDATLGEAADLPELRRLAVDPVAPRVRTWDDSSPPPVVFREDDVRDPVELVWRLVGKAKRLGIETFEPGDLVDGGVNSEIRKRLADVAPSLKAKLDVLQARAQDESQDGRLPQIYLRDLDRQRATALVPNIVDAFNRFVGCGTSIAEDCPDPLYAWDVEEFYAGKDSHDPRNLELHWYQHVLYDPVCRFAPGQILNEDHLRRYNQAIIQSLYRGVLRGRESLPFLVEMLSDEIPALCEAAIAGISKLTESQCAGTAYRRHLLRPGMRLSLLVDGPYRNRMATRPAFESRSAPRSGEITVNIAYLPDSNRATLDSARHLFLANVLRAQQGVHKSDSRKQMLSFLARADPRDDLSPTLTALNERSSAMWNALLSPAIGMLNVRSAPDPRTRTQVEAFVLRLLTDAPVDGFAGRLAGRGLDPGKGPTQQDDPDLDLQVNTLLGELVTTWQSYLAMCPTGGAFDALLGSGTAGFAPVSSDRLEDHWLRDDAGAGSENVPTLPNLRCTSDSSGDVSTCRSERSLDEHDATGFDLQIRVDRGLDWQSNPNLNPRWTLRHWEASRIYGYVEEAIDQIEFLRLSAPNPAVTADPCVQRAIDVKPGVRVSATVQWPGDRDPLRPNVELTLCRDGRHALTRIDGMDTQGLRISYRDLRRLDPPPWAPNPIAAAVNGGADPRSIHFPVTRYLHDAPISVRYASGQRTIRIAYPPGDSPVPEEMLPNQTHDAIDASWDSINGFTIKRRDGAFEHWRPLEAIATQIVPSLGAYARSVYGWDAFRLHSPDVRGRIREIGVRTGDLDEVAFGITRDPCKATYRVAKIAEGDRIHFQQGRYQCTGGRLSSDPPHFEATFASDVRPMLHELVLDLLTPFEVTYVEGLTRSRLLGFTQEGP